MEKIEQALTERPPRLLYHYTDVDGFMGIVRTKMMQATVIYCLNDMEEFTRTFQMLIDQINTRENLSLELKSILLKYLEQISEIPIFVASFSEEGNLLSQWRAYGKGSGISIGFTGEYLNNIANKSKVALRKCIYDPSRHMDLIRILVDQINEEYLVLRSNNDSRSHDNARVVIENNFYSYVTMLAPIIKNKAFSEEKEWRIVSGIDYVDESRVNYKSVLGVVAPYFELPIVGAKGQCAIEEIYLGPTKEPDLAHRFVAQFLEKNSVKWSRIKASLIPYRGN